MLKRCTCLCNCKRVDVLHEFHTCSIAQESDVDVVAVLCCSQHGASVDTVVIVGCVQHYGTNTVVLHTQVHTEGKGHCCKYQVLLHHRGQRWGSFTHHLASILPWSTCIRDGSCLAPRPFPLPVFDCLR